MKKLTKVEQAQLELLIDRAQSNGQPIPLYSHIQIDCGVAQDVHTSKVDLTLDERGNRYGDFSDHARIAQALQDTMRNHSIPKYDSQGNSSHVVIPWDNLGPVYKQALTVIADKIARILNGDPNYADNWHDIQGYAKLVEDRLPKQGE